MNTDFFPIESAVFIRQREFKIISDGDGKPTGFLLSLVLLANVTW